MDYQIHHQKEVDSTNLWAKELASQGAPEGTVALADCQSAGRGRRGRTWFSPKDSSIYMSLILRPHIKPEQASMLTLVMGLSAAQACRDILNLEAWIKWPNDVVINKKKVCGVLTEMQVFPEGIQYVIIGVGINVNQTVFPDSIAETTTSLACEKGFELKKEEVMAAVLESFSRNYEIFLRTGTLRELMVKYNYMLISKDREIRVLDPVGEYSGVSGGINEKGELLVTKEDGTCAAVYAGEVSVRGVYGYV